MYYRAIKKNPSQGKKVKKEVNENSFEYNILFHDIKILFYRCSFRAYHKFSYENWILDSQRRKVSLTNR